MRKEERYLSYLKTCGWTHVIFSILDVPILILLWWLNYKVGFWVCLVLMVLSEIGHGILIEKLQIKAGVKV